MPKLISPRFAFALALIFLLTIGAANFVRIPSAAAEERAEIEFAALGAPSFPIFLKTTTTRCAQTAPFQFNARLTMQSPASSDQTLTEFLQDVKRLQDIRRDHYKQNKLFRNSDVALIRALFFDALSGNSDAIRFLQNQKWSGKLPVAFNRAQQQLLLYKKVCSTTQQPHQLDVDQSKSPDFIGVLSWADKQSVTATLTQKQPDQIITHLPVISEVKPEEATIHFANLGVADKSFLFIDHRLLGSAEAVRNGFPSEVELRNLSAKIKTEIRKLGRQQKVVVVSNHRNLHDPDRWQTLKISKALQKTLKDSFAKQSTKRVCLNKKRTTNQRPLESSEIVLEKIGYFSKPLNAYFVGMHPASKNESEGCPEETMNPAHPSDWYLLDSHSRLILIRSNIRPLAAVAFGGESRSRWLVESNENPVELIDLKEVGKEPAQNPVDSAQ